MLCSLLLFELYNLALGVKNRFVNFIDVSILGWKIVCRLRVVITFFAQYVLDVDDREEGDDVTSEHVIANSDIHADIPPSTAALDPSDFVEPPEMSGADSLADADSDNGEEVMPDNLEDIAAGAGSQPLQSEATGPYSGSRSPRFVFTHRHRQSIFSHFVWPLPVLHYSVTTVFYWPIFPI